MQEGATRMKNGRQEVLKNSRWRPVEPKGKATPRPGLAVVQDEPATKPKTPKAQDQKTLEEKAIQLENEIHELNTRRSASSDHDERRDLYSRINSKIDEQQEVEKQLIKQWGLNDDSEGRKAYEERIFNQGGRGRSLAEKRKQQAEKEEKYQQDREKQHKEYQRIHAGNERWMRDYVAKQVKSAKPKRGKVTLNTNNSNPDANPVVSASIYGPMSVHKDGRYYALSHVASGKRIRLFSSKDTANKVAAVLSSEIDWKDVPEEMPKDELARAGKIVLALEGNGFYDASEFVDLSKPPKIKGDAPSTLKPKAPKAKTSRRTVSTEDVDASAIAGEIQKFEEFLATVDAGLAKVTPRKRKQIEKYIKELTEDLLSKTEVDSEISGLSDDDLLNELSESIETGNDPEPTLGDMPEKSDGHIGFDHETGHEYIRTRSGDVSRASISDPIMPDGRRFARFESTAAGWASHPVKKKMDGETEPTLGDMLSEQKASEQGAIAGGESPLRPKSKSSLTVKPDKWGGSHITATEKKHIKAGLEQGATEWKTSRKYYKVSGTKDGQTVVNIYDLPLKNGFGKPVDNADDAKPTSKALVSGL